MKKYVLMLVGLVGASVLGGVGIIYSFVNSAPMHVSRIELESTPVAEAEGTTAVADSGAHATIIMQ